MAMELDKTAMKPKQDRIRQDPEALSDDMKLTELKVGMTVGVWSATQGLWYKATIGEISDTAILCNLAAGGAKKVRPAENQVLSGYVRQALLDSDFTFPGVVAGWPEPVQGI